MVKTLYTILSVIILCCWEILTFSQVIDDPGFKIENINFYILNNQMNINYDLVNARPKDRFTVSAKIFSESGNLLNKSELFGHVGDNITAGNILNNFFSRDIMYSVFKSTNHTRKNIIWDLSKDLTEINENVYVEITAMHNNAKYFKPVSKTGAIMLSTLWPGWGSYRTRFRPEHFGRGMLGYILAAGSYHYYNLTEKAYDTYLTQTSTEGRNMFFSNTEKYYRTHRNLMYAAISVWAVEYANILFFENLSKRSGYRSEITLMDAGGIKVPSLTLVHNF